MQSFLNFEDFSSVENNKIIGAPVEMKNSKIEFYGEHNILFFDENVVLDSSTIRFLGNDSVVFISSSGNHRTKVKVDIYNKSAFYMGKNCNTTRPLHIVLSERKHIVIGNDCLFSLEIWFRNADPHLIYDASSKKRINPSKSVFVGDHVWIGQNAFVSKGTIIGSGSIIGAMSVTGGKTIPSNCSCGGVPCKVIKNGIFWLKPSVHAYDEEKTENSKIYNKDTYIYNNDKNILDFKTLDKKLSSCKNSDEMLAYLTEEIFKNKNKNRFYIPLDENKGGLLNRMFSK